MDFGSAIWISECYHAGAYGSLAFSRAELKVILSGLLSSVRVVFLRTSLKSLVLMRILSLFILSL